jgi:hypothetical protein
MYANFTNNTVMFYTDITLYFAQPRTFSSPKSIGLYRDPLGEGEGGRGVLGVATFSTAEHEFACKAN